MQVSVTVILTRNMIHSSMSSILCYVTLQTQMLHVRRFGAIRVMCICQVFATGKLRANQNFSTFQCCTCVHVFGSKWEASGWFVIPVVLLIELWSDSRLPLVHLLGQLPRPLVIMLAAFGRKHPWNNQFPWIAFTERLWKLCFWVLTHFDPPRPIRKVSAPLWSRL